MVNNDWLDIDVLEDYLDGKLDAKAMHFVERQALDDPFVAEALEGLRQSPKRKQTLSILQKQLYDRVSEKPIRRKMWGVTTQRLSIAATATVAFIAVSILFFMRETNRKNAETAARKADGIVVNLDTNNALATTKPAPKDTLKAPGSTSAFIDEAIVKAKTGDLAKNAKVAPAQRANPTISVPQPNQEVAVLSTEKHKVLARRSDAPALNETVVSASPSVASGEIVFSGNVIDQANGKPIGGAVVRLAGSRHVTATNADGSFALPADSSSKDKNLLVSAIGFKEIPVAGMQDPNAIRNAMTGDKSLQEIALITGSNGRKKENIAAPKITLRAEQNLNGKPSEEITKPIPVSTINYNEYLERNNKLYNPKGPEKYVILSFKVKKNGRPTDVSVIKSLNKNADAEAKRLIVQGPDWVLPKNGNNVVELSVKF